MTPRPSPDAAPWHRPALVAVVALAVVARLLAVALLDPPLDSDAASYLAMARTMLAPGPMRDLYGNLAFYSPGYPLLLTLGGGTLAGAQAINVALAVAATLLVHHLARAVTGSAPLALIAAAGFAVLVPSVAGAAMVERENLSVPLLLALVAVALSLPGADRPRRQAALAGLIYGAALLAGASVLLTAGVIVVALLMRRAAWREVAAALAAFVAGAALVVAPWLLHVTQVLGRPVLTTNGPFNLYIGNNPAATGWFVSMRDTPMGPRWRQLHATAGELAATDTLGRLAVEHVRAHPGDTARLALVKLGAFWLPDPPRAGDAGGSVITLARWVEVAQQMLLLAGGLVALAGWRRWTGAHRLVALAVLAFWIIHAAAYVIPRYRQPAMPLVLVLAVAALPSLVRRPRWRASLA